MNRFDQLIRYLESDLTQAEAKQLEAELAGSAARREELARVEALTGKLAAPDPALEELDLLPGVRAQLKAPAPSTGRRWVVPAGAAMALAASLLLVVRWLPDDGFRAKGGTPAAGFADGRWAGIDVYRAGAQGASRAETRLAAGEALAFSYRNAGEQPFTHLMIFAVDARGQVFWFHPAWTDARQDPKSISIVASAATVELREAVTHDFVPGPLVIHAVFTRAPLKVSEVEKMLPHGLQLPGALEQRLTFEVER